MAELGRGLEELSNFVKGAPPPGPFDYSALGGFLAFLAAYRPCAGAAADRIKGFKDRAALLVGHLILSFVAPPGG